MLASSSVGNRHREPTPNAALERLELTPREIEVLALLAGGLTNREIGAELFISDKTASVHVSRILTKLSVPNRVAAAAAAHHLGLTPARRPPPSSQTASGPHAAGASRPGAAARSGVTSAPTAEPVMPPPRPDR